MSSFFTAPTSQKKRKREDATASVNGKRRSIGSGSATRQRSEPATRRQERSESISGSESEDDRPNGNVAYESDTSEDEYQAETAAEKRLRLAEQYLENVRQEVDEAGFDAAEIDKDLIAERLKEDVAESKGKIYRHIAQDLDIDHAEQTFFRADQMNITALACCAPYIYTVAKDMSVVKWQMPDSQDVGSADGDSAQATNITPAKRPKKLAFSRGRRSHNKAYLGHTSQILCAAASSTGRFLATGGLDRRLVIWDVSSPNKLQPIKVFTHHRDAVIGLAFRRGTNQLYSSSRDRTVKVWSLDELAYVETLFGHQDSVVGIAGASREICVSVGARDRTARLWKVGEETQLVFRGGGIPGKNKTRDEKKRNGYVNGAPNGLEATPETQYGEGSMDVVAMVDDETFVTGADNGSISLWSVHKKKAVATIPLAHGIDPPMPLEDAFAEQDLSARRPPAPPGPRWITALTTIPYSDVVLSGSWDGVVRAWRISEDKRSLQDLGVVSTAGTELLLSNGTHKQTNGNVPKPSKQIEGVIADITAFERGERGKGGISVIIGVSPELRLGRWKSFTKRSTAVLLSVSRRRSGHMANGVDGIDQEEPGLS